VQFPGTKLLLAAAAFVLVGLLLNFSGLSWLGREFIAGGLGAVVHETLHHETTEVRDACADAETHWKSTEARNSLVAFKDHLARFPTCPFATLAKEAISAIEGNARPTSSPSQEDYDLVRRVYKSIGPQPPERAKCDPNGILPPNWKVICGDDVSHR